MPRRRGVSKGSFRAHSGDGEEFIVFVYQEAPRLCDQSPPVATDGALTLQLPDGRFVKRIDKGQFEIADVPATPLTTADPRAP